MHVHVDDGADVGAHLQRVPDASADEDIPMCTDLLVCYLNTFNEGLRGGDVGAIIDPSATDDEYFTFKLVYELSYYVIVITIILSNASANRPSAVAAQLCILLASW